MNFIDTALKNHLECDDFLQEIAVNIYSHSEIRDIIVNYPQFVADAIAIIDYDTNLSMDGDIFVNDSDKFPNIIIALHNCGIDNDVVILKKLQDLYNNDDDNFWSEQGDNLYSELMWNKEIDRFWLLVKNYINHSLSNYYKQKDL